MFKNKNLLLFMLFALLISSACASKEKKVSPTGEAAKVAGVEVKAREALESEWDKLVAMAKKEGKVNVASAMGAPEVRDAISKGFKTKYGVEVEFVIMRPAEIAQKLVMERKAGLHNWDIYIGGSTTVTTVLKPSGYLDPIRPALMLPEVLNPAAYWNGELPLTAYGYAISIVKYVSESLLINTDLAKMEEIKSYKDILNPKWKGKILMDDPTTAGSAEKLASYIYIQNIAGGADFLRDLVRQEPTITRDRRILTEWIARGKYAIAISARPEMTMPFIKMGAPLKYITPVEGVYVTHGGSAAGLINEPLHPNAARVFLNWLLTKEAGELWSRAQEVQSSRVDVSTDFLNPDFVRKPGVKYFDSDNEEFMAKLQEVVTDLKAIFAPIIK